VLLSEWLDVQEVALETTGQIDNWVTESLISRSQRYLEQRTKAFQIELNDQANVKRAWMDDLYQRSLSPRHKFDTARWPDDDDDICPCCGYSRY
jgi:hypothetical protein